MYACVYIYIYIYIYMHKQGGEGCTYLPINTYTHTCSDLFEHAKVMHPDGNLRFSLDIVGAHLLILLLLVVVVVVGVVVL